MSKLSIKDAMAKGLLDVDAAKRLEGAGVESVVQPDQREGLHLDLNIDPSDVWGGKPDHRPEYAGIMVRFTKRF